MIILRKLGTQQSDCRFVMADQLVGLTDGDNQLFTVSYEYSPGKIEVIYNGQVLTSPVDFEETGLDEITFNYIKPLDISVLKANYLVGDCDDSGFSPSEPVPPGSTNFLELTDTPTTYSGFENHCLRVNAAGSGIDFVLPGGDTSGTIDGIEPIPNGSTTVDVTFTSAIVTDYVITASLENKGDAEPSVYPVLIKNKNVMGFTAEFSDDIDSDNYYLHWRASNPNLSTSMSLEGFDLSAVSVPTPVGNIDLGDNLILLDPKPNGLSAHGYEIGYSGDASLMVVFDNPTGFACPLYMRVDGKWGPCTAENGTTQMPCTALALDEDDGLQKVFWRGNIRKGSWNWTPGDKIYVSTVEGAITNVKPNGGSWPQVIGIAISNDTIRFDPDLTSENPNS